MKWTCGITKLLTRAWDLLNSSLFIDRFRVKSQDTWRVLVGGSGISAANTEKMQFPIQQWWWAHVSWNRLLDSLLEPFQNPREMSWRMSQKCTAVPPLQGRSKKMLTKLVQTSLLRHWAEEEVGRELGNTLRLSAQNSNVRLCRWVSNLLTAYANHLKVEREKGARLLGGNKTVGPRGWRNAGLSGLFQTR